MLYFAYGSNMDWQQMQDRCPSAQFVGVAVLKDHELKFPRKSKNWGGGVASVVPAPERRVWGVVYEIADRDIGNLDRFERYDPGKRTEDNAYNREERHVFINERDEERLLVSLYIAQQEENPPPPSRDYLNKIATGARFWHLPDEYVEWLEHQPVSKREPQT